MTPAEIAKLPTPRTDAAVFDAADKELGHDGERRRIEPERPAVDADFARTLEQKLAAAVMALEWYADAEWITSDDLKEGIYIHDSLLDY